jgi:hypothetical protein
MMAGRKRASMNGKRAGIGETYSKVLITLLFDATFLRASDPDYLSRPGNLNLYRYGWHVLRGAGGVRITCCIAEEEMKRGWIVMTWTSPFPSKTHQYGQGSLRYPKSLGVRQADSPLGFCKGDEAQRSGLRDKPRSSSGSQ